MRQRQNGPHSRIDAASGPFALVVAGGGFEPPKAKPTVLQTAPFGHSGNLPGAAVLGSREKNSGQRDRLRRGRAGTLAAVRAPIRSIRCDDWLRTRLT